jgi:hypothetical protein
LEFDQASRRVQTYTLEQMGRHADSQSETYAKTVASSNLQTQYDAAGLVYNDPAHMDKLRADTIYFADQKTRAESGANADPTIFATNRTVALSNLYKSQIVGASVQNPALASNLFQQHQNELTPADRVMLESHLKSVNTGLNADRAVSGAIGGGVATPATGVIVSEARSQGVDPVQALTIAKIESGVGTVADTPGNPNKGLYQLGPQEWTQNGGQPWEHSDVAAQARVGVASIPKSAAAAAAAVGHPPEPWQTYIVHQQGMGGGPALLKANPALNVVDALAPAYGGDRATATRAIAGNGGDPNGTVGQFLGLWQAKYADAQNRVAGTLPGGTTSTGVPGAPVNQLPPRDVAIDRVLQATANDPQAQQQALARLNSVYAMQERAKRDAAEKSGNAVVTQLLTNKPVDLAAVANDPNLSYEQKYHLAEMVRASQASGGGDKQLATYGPKFYDYLQQATAAPDAPDRINDPSTLWQHVASGELTVAGVEKLSGIVQGAKTPEGAADAKMLDAFLSGAKAQISKDGILGMADPKGQQRYAEWMTHVLPAFDAGKKQGLTAAQMLDPKSKDYIGGSISQFTRSMPELTEDLNSGGAAALDLSTKAGIVAAYSSGKITRDVAAQALIRGGFATAPTPAPVVSVPPMAPTE